MRRVRGRLARGHGQAKEEVIAPGKVGESLIDCRALGLRDAEKVGVELALEQQRGSRVAAVKLVSHVQGPHHERLQRDASRPPDGLADGGGHDVGDEVKLVAHPVVIGAVVEPPTGLAFVEVAKGEIPERAVLDHENRH